MNELRRLWRGALPRLRALLAEFGQHFQPVSMATSAETGAFLHALVQILRPGVLIETGSGFSSAVLEGALRAENDRDYAARVQQWLAGRGLAPGRFVDYDTLHRLSPGEPFLLFLDGDLRTRDATAQWLSEHLEHAALVIDDAQDGTFVQVAGVLERLRADARGELIDLAAWTRDGYGRHAALWLGRACGADAALRDAIRLGPGPLEAPPALLMLCINDTPDNQRWAGTARTLTSLGITARLAHHELWIVDNGSTCPASAHFLRQWCEDRWRDGARLRLFRLPTNRYATYAFNRLLALAPAPATVVRVENDIEFHTDDWPSLLGGFLLRSGFGLVSALPQDLPHKASGVPPGSVAGLAVHEVDELPGFCTAFAPGLREQLGAWVSAGRYIEDVLTSERARAAGWRLAFVARDELRCFHVDRAASAGYAQWKRDVVRAEWDRMLSLREGWRSGREPVHRPFEFAADDGFAELAPPV